MTLTVTQASSCSYSVSPTVQSIPSAGGSQTVAVTTATGCAWTGVSNSAPWIAVTSGGSGTGNGTLGYFVAGNPTTASRTGTLTVAGQTVTITQPAACTFTLSSTAQPAPAAGGPLTTTVTAGSGCTWTTVSHASWIAVTSGSGTANGTASYSVAANGTGGTRTGTLTIAGQAVTITQFSSSMPPRTPTNVRVSP